jgi:hypothetical protein
MADDDTDPTVTDDSQGALPTSGDMAPDGPQGQPDQDNDVTGSLPDTGGATGAAAPAMGTEQQPAEKAESNPLIDMIKGLFDFGHLKHGIGDHAQQAEGEQGAVPTSQPPATQPQQAQPQGPQEDQGVLPTMARGAGRLAQRAASAVTEFPANAKRIMRYLQGADAMDPNSVAAINNAVDPKGTLPEWQRNYQAFQYAQHMAGPDASWSMLQHFRKTYDAMRSYAAGAFDKGGYPSALEGMNKAYAALPSMNHVNFTMGQNGITATVTNYDGKATGYNLTPDQFKALMTSKSGLFDTVAVTPFHDIFKGIGAPPAQADSDFKRPVDRATPQEEALAPAAAAKFPRPEQEKERLAWIQKQIGERNRLTDVGDQRQFPGGRGAPDTTQKSIAQQKQDTTTAHAGDKATIAAGRDQTNQTIAAGKNVAAGERAAGRTQSNEKIASDKNQSAENRTNTRAGAVDRSTIERLQQARERNKSTETTAAQHFKGRALDTLLKSITPGMDFETVNGALKKHGTSIDELLAAGNPQQAPTASSQGSVVPGAPQVTSQQNSQPQGQWGINKATGKAEWRPTPGGE